ncbi:ArdC-like ssDNA-binding domain-containing protein [Pseudarthrobacter sp. MDT3-28]|uniref:ArdC-like ssDNA-binding domain-containing protein n=1 Tax=Pseudarthrobacter raffinosi TaxID=2953651 RepID=UPI00208EDB56|nr:ArdC-like ssDNA-binding domain-containing protein [Pseudarthrobacter sp. MDT3-28]MCO4239434.1 ArdC-like ssDNA-binding domain-containing protein [Pseudarthrobacter sp. MDT3-28]
MAPGGDAESSADNGAVGKRLDPEARIIQLTGQLHAILEVAISAPARWHQLLDTSATLWRYSGGNVALLMAQREQLGLQPPTLVAGYREWERHGRVVLKGEHALWVLAPRTAPKNSDPSEATGKGTAGVRGGEEPGAGPRADRKIVGWRGQAVFDVSQTEGEPIYVPRAGVGMADVPEGLWRSLVHVAERRRFAVDVTGSQRSMSSGFTDFAHRQIQVGAWLGPEDAAAVLAHELGHAYLHGPDDKVGALYGSGLHHRGLAEVEAESVAYTVLRAHGIDRGAQSSNYLAGWADKVIDVERAAWSGDGEQNGLLTRMDIARSTLGRVTATCREILQITQPVGAGGKLTSLQAPSAVAPVDTYLIQGSPRPASADIRAK